MPNWFDRRLSVLSGWEGYRYSVSEPPGKMIADLDANENWQIPEAELRRAIANALRGVDARGYPEDAVAELQRAISKRLGVARDSVVPCSGGDQAIDLLCQAFLKAGDRAVIVAPTFSMYRLRATIAGADCVEVPMGRDFSLPTRQLGRLSSQGGVLFICSPNNPTGNQFTEKEVLAAIEAFRGLVVLDEAYVDFADFSLSKRVAEFQNLAVLRTFSKAYGMAGMRLGFILANESWAPDFLAKVQYPYPVSSVAAATALSLMRQANIVREWCARVKRERGWFSAQLGRIDGVRVVESQANFLLVSMPVDSALLHSRLLRRGLTTRNVGGVLNLRNCLRITVGTRRMNESLLRGVREVLDAEA